MTQIGAFPSKAAPVHFQTGSSFRMLRTQQVNAVRPKLPVVQVEFFFKFFPRQTQRQGNAGVKFPGYSVEAVAAFNVHALYRTDGMRRRKTFKQFLISLFIIHLDARSPVCFSASFPGSSAGNFMITRKNAKNNRFFTILAVIDALY
jgi:hypothetical protein